VPCFLFYFGLEIKYISEETFSDHSEQDQSEKSQETSPETSYIKPESQESIKAVEQVQKNLADSIKPKQGQTSINIE
jgi:hypothetical protein